MDRSFLKGLLLLLILLVCFLKILFDRSPRSPVVPKVGRYFKKELISVKLSAKNFTRYKRMDRKSKHALDQKRT